MRNYAESFALETTRKTADERRREPPATNAFSPARHAREFSAGSSEGANAFSRFSDEGERSENDGFFDGISDDDEPRADAATPRTESDGRDAVFQTAAYFSAAELVSTDAEDSRAENTHKRAGAVALRPDVFLPSQTSLRAISSAAASGKSSSWFFCSKDSRFLVKTCSLKERDVLLDILGEYSKHAETHRGTSLLPQYYGLYTIEVGSRSAHFIIMNYWFATMHAISKRFDLKGSTKGRPASRKGTRQRRRGGVEGSGLFRVGRSCTKPHGGGGESRHRDGRGVHGAEQAHRLLHDGRAALSRRRGDRRGRRRRRGRDERRGERRASVSRPPTASFRVRLVRGFERRQHWRGFGALLGRVAAADAVGARRIRKSATRATKTNRERTPPRDRTRSISRVRSRSPRRTTRVCNFSSARSRRRSA